MWLAGGREQFAALWIVRRIVRPLLAWLGVVLGVASRRRCSDDRCGWIQERCGRFEKDVMGFVWFTLPLSDVKEWTPVG